MKLNTIFFIGPQGSGKGTQAKILAKRLNFFYWEMGGLLRQVAASPSELGQKVKKLIDSGILLTDEQLYEVVDSRLGEIAPDQGVIFDGIPRRVPQAEHLMEFLQGQGRKNFVTLFVNLPKEESVARLLKRAEIEKRADDTREKIEFRLQQYENDTLPVLDYLRRHSMFFEIDGQPTVEEVNNIINKALSL
ncbi:MAG: nucleoside monophosphate kinase [Candidatus Doudnabacteria bacterium]|nr:nucleoside monophosphate kinase [Candidatus Doudnabacteria bacterium]